MALGFSLDCQLFCMFVKDWVQTVLTEDVNLVFPK